MSVTEFDRPTLVLMIDRHATRQGALLPLLHEVQHAFGYIPAESVEAIAKGLHLSRAEVHGVITYYAHFRSEPPGQVVLQMCRAEACQARGAGALIAHAERMLDCRMGATRADRAVTLEPVYCLGHCATGPNIQIDQRLYGRVDARRLNQLMAALVPEAVAS